MEGFFRANPNLQVSSLIANIATPAPCKTSDLQLYLDAGLTDSYPGTGTTWFDLSGNSRNFTLENTSYTSDNGGALIFNGSSAKATISHTVSQIFRRTDAITYEMFVRPSGVGSSNVAGVSVSNGQGTGGITISTTSTSFLFTPSNPLSDRSISGSFSSNKTNTWVHFVFTVNYSSQTYAMYENGFAITATPSGSWTTMTPSTSYQQSITDAIGARYINSWQYWGGRIGVVRMYSSLLSATEVARNFDCDRRRYGL